MARLTTNWIDRVIGTVAPHRQLQRIRARVASAMVLRHYEAASVGRRTQNWNRSASDANTANGIGALAYLRDVARDLVRNNPYAEAAVATIVDHTVGWGITAKTRDAKAAARWKAWADSTLCDADGVHTLAGLQKLILRTVVVSGECLVRRRSRLLSDGLPIPLQLQVLEPDYLDTNKSGATPNGGVIVQGVEFGPLGDVAAYWLFQTHPGATLGTTASTIFPGSRRIPASEIIHVFNSKRPGQARGASWFSPVILRLKEIDEYEDATVVKQKIAACLSVVTSDVDGTGQGLGTTDDTPTPGTDTLSPGAVLNIPAGRTVSVVQPPSVSEYSPFIQAQLRAVATGLHVTYEDLTGDFSQVNFSSGRLARLKHWARVEDWRWRMLVPQACDRMWAWAMEALVIAGELEAVPEVRWSAPPMPMLEPDKEGLAHQRLVRNHLQSWSESVRQMGYDPDDVLDEMREDMRRFDTAGIISDIDPRRTTQAGQYQSTAEAGQTGGGQ